MGMYCKTYSYAFFFKIHFSVCSEEKQSLFSLALELVVAPISFASVWQKYLVEATWGRDLFSLTILKYWTNSWEDRAKQLVEVARTRGSDCSCHSGQGSREFAGPGVAHNLQKLIYGDWPAFPHQTPPPEGANASQNSGQCETRSGLE